MDRNEPTGLPDDLFKDYRQKNEKIFRYDPSIPLPRGFVLLSWEDPCRTSVWDEIARQYPRITWLFYVSRAGFSGDGSFSLVYVERYSGIASYGYGIVLKKENNEWNVVYTRPMWSGG